MEKFTTPYGVTIVTENSQPSEHLANGVDVTVTLTHGERSWVGDATIAPRAYNGTLGAPEGCGGRDGWLSAELCRAITELEARGIVGEDVAEAIEEASAAAVPVSWQEGRCVVADGYLSPHLD